MHASSPSVFAQSKSHRPARALSVRLLPAAFAMLLVMSRGASADTALLNTFSPGLGLLNASAYDPIHDTMWAKPQFGDFRQYTRAGTLLSTVPDSTPSDDSDFTFSLSAMNIGGTTVPAGTLLYGNGDAPGGAKLYGLNPVTGATLAQVSIPAFAAGGNLNGNMVGMAYSVARDTFFLLGWSGSRIMEFNAKTGLEVNAFTVNPSGSTSYSVYYGDIEVNVATGNLLVVSSNNPTSVLRELTPTGAFVKDVSMAGLGVTGESGLGLDNVRGEMWISSTNGNLYQVGGFDPVPEPTSAGLLAAVGCGIASMIRRRRA